MAGNFKVLLAEGLKMTVDEDGIATVYMINGENRVRLSFVQAWMKVLEEIERNSAIKGLIITGMDKYFSLGLDLDYFATQTAEYVERTTENTVPLFRRITLLPIPTVAAINGHTYGAGAFMAIACDYRVMGSKRGWFCFPEAALGMQMKERSFKLIRMKIGIGNPQRDAVIFSKRLTASEARALQIVDEAESADKLLSTAKRLIKECLGKHGIDRASLGQMKKNVFGMQSWQHDGDSKL